MVATLIIMLIGGWCAAACIQWEPKERPPISITEGYDQALKALSQDAARFHCIAANIQCSHWVYTFSSSANESRWVIVNFRGGVSVNDHAPVWK